MKRQILTLFIMLTGMASMAQTADKAWSTTYNEIVSRIKAPVFKQKD